MVYWLASFWHCTSMKWIPPEDERRLSDESVEVWHTSRHSHRLSASVWSYFNGEVCDPSAAMGQCFVAFLGSLRCLVDCGAKSCKPMGVRFIGSDSCRKSVASMNQLGRISNIGRLFLLYFPQPQLKQCEMYDCMMMSLQHWSNDMHRLRMKRSWLDRPLTVHLVTLMKRTYAYAILEPKGRQKQTMLSWECYTSSPT